MRDGSLLTPGYRDKQSRTKTGCPESCLGIEDGARDRFRRGRLETSRYEILLLMYQTHIDGRCLQKSRHYRL